jgi:hypothetical protein
MAHFAKVENGIVTQVIVIDQETLNTGHWGDPASWVQTSYNTSGGVHSQGGTPLRGNYAGIGYIYDAENDVFYAPSPYPSWVLNRTKWNYEAPVARPDDNNVYHWDEATTSWIQLPETQAAPTSNNETNVT